MRTLILIAFGIAIAAAVFYFWPRGVRVVVFNAGTSPMTSVTVAVTGGTIAMPDIRPGEIRSVRVKPTGDSGITLNYTDAAGARSVPVDCYIGGSGYRGSISIDVANGAPTKVNDAIKIGVF